MKKKLNRKRRIGTYRKTERGFGIVEFKDYYQVPCSIQCSSLAIYVRPGTSALWIGPDDPDPKVMWKNAAKVGIKTDATEGWVPYPIPEEVLLNTRMHLDYKQVKLLVARLQSWIRTGSLK